jgi:hypothetical protein
MTERQGKELHTIGGVVVVVVIIVVVVSCVR